VIGTSRSDVELDGLTRIIHPKQISEVLPEVSAVVSTLPGTQATYHLLDADFFARLNPGTTLVNVGRGTVIDESALLDALNTGRVGFAALDVFEVEPLPESSPLWPHPQVLVSPHTAALTANEEHRIAVLFAENATRLLADKPLQNLINRLEFY